MHIGAFGGGGGGGADERQTLSTRKPVDMDLPATLLYPNSKVPNYGMLLKKHPSSKTLPNQISP